MNDLIDRQSAIDAIMDLRKANENYYQKTPCKGYWELTAAMTVMTLLPSVQLEANDDLVSKSKLLDFISDMEEQSLHYDVLVNKIIMVTTNCIKKYLDIMSSVKPEEITK